MTLRWVHHGEERLNQTSIHIDLIVVKNFFGNFSFGISPSGGFQFDTYGGILADDLDALQGLLIKPYSQNHGQNHHYGEHHVVVEGISKKYKGNKQHFDLIEQECHLVMLVAHPE